jgi:hypothetical protein
MKDLEVTTGEKQIALVWTRNFEEPVKLVVVQGTPKSMTEQLDEIAGDDGDWTRLKYDQSNIKAWIKFFITLVYTLMQELTIGE